MPTHSNGNGKLASRAVARIESLRVTNFRSLQRIDLKEITPLTVFVGPNGSGKSTLFDVLSFLSECFRIGLSEALSARDGMAELRTRGQSGPLTIEFRFRESPSSPLITYHVSIDEGPHGPFVQHEWAQWRRRGTTAPFRFLDVREGRGYVARGEQPGADSAKEELALRSADLLAISSLGQYAEHPRLAAIKDFIADWYILDLSARGRNGQREIGPKKRLGPAGDNLANVVLYLHEHDSDRLKALFREMSGLVPRFEQAALAFGPSGLLDVLFKDSSFQEPSRSKFVSAGTLALMKDLIVLGDPDPPKILGIEEPETFLHPRLLPHIAERCMDASSRTQILVTTHSPNFINPLRPNQIRVFFRDQDGFTQVRQASEIRGVPEQFRAGGLLGDLWLEGHFRVGDPLSDTVITSTYQPA